uniref:Uncharacterized protein n=1 Tax=Ciona intestinalis TaxID=7719 RepID=F6SU46_CIOIN
QHFSSCFSSDSSSSPKPLLLSGLIVVAVVADGQSGTKRAACLTKSWMPWKKMICTHSNKRPLYNN